MVRSPPALLIAPLAAAPTPAADPAHPTMVELRQSQGCSGCSPAIAKLTALAGTADVLAWVFAVTYRDRPGRHDTLAKPAFAASRWDHA